MKISPLPRAESSCIPSIQELGASFEKTSDIPAGMEEDVAKWREALIDAAVELDDAAMEAYLEVNHLLCDLKLAGLHFFRLMLTIAASCPTFYHHD